MGEKHLKAAELASIADRPIGLDLNFSEIVFVCVPN
jgi:hypothetical protein